MSRLRVLVADDSPTVRQHLCEVLRRDPEIDVVAEAADGQEAIDLCARLRPDAVTLDMMMPKVTGLAATEHIMAHCPTPILIVSASVNRGELFHTYDALAAGAVDVLEKPTGSEDDWQARFVRAVKLVARVRVITHPRATLRALGRRDPPRPEPATRTRRAPSVGDGDLAPGAARSVIAIGASTGGPGAIVDVLRALPAPCPTPVLVVLHIALPFGAALAEWLDDQTPHPVALATDGDHLAALAGRVVMAPPDRHLAVRDGRLWLSAGPERHSCRPSVDVLFESLARELGHRTVAALLTGMGRDGASGMAALRVSGALTIAQDEATCVVYGMPREAVLLDAAERVLPLPEIGHALARAIGAIG